MKKFRHWIKIFSARLQDVLFLLQAGMAISLGLVVLGALLILLNAALPLPSFLEQWISAIAVSGAELSSRTLALILAVCLILMWLWCSRRN